MSSTIRLFVNDKRISTAVKLNSGSILQVYPTKRPFATDVEWKQFWEDSLKPKIIIRFSDGEEKQTSAPVAAPAAPKTKSKTIKAVRLQDWDVKPSHSFSHTLPAGTYYIGDLCYALSDDVYDKVFGGMGYDSGIYAEKGTDRVFLVNGTSYGDGLYLGTDGKEFAVDAGIIGICSQSLMGKDGNGGHVYTFESPVTCSFKKDGRFYFSSSNGRLMIDTAGYDDDY